MMSSYAGDGVVPVGNLTSHDCTISDVAGAPRSCELKSTF